MGFKQRLYTDKLISQSKSILILLILQDVWDVWMYATFFMPSGKKKPDFLDLTCFASCVSKDQFVELKEMHGT